MLKKYITVLAITIIVCSICFLIAREIYFRNADAKTEIEMNKAKQLILNNSVHFIASGESMGNHMLANQEELYGENHHMKDGYGKDLSWRCNFDTNIRSIVSAGRDGIFNTNDDIVITFELNSSVKNK